MTSSRPFARSRVAPRPVLRPSNPFPHLAGVETRLHPGQHENQHPQNEQRYSRDHRRVIRNLDQRDQHPQHHDLDHAPGSRGRMMAQQRPHPSRRALEMGAEHDRQHQTDLQRRRDHSGQQHQHRDHLLPIAPQVLGASDHGSGGRAPDDRQAEHRNRVCNHVEQSGPQRQRERPIERVLAVAPQLLVAARTARRRPRREIRHPLQQVAMQTSDERGIGDRFVVHEGYRRLRAESAGTRGSRRTVRCTLV